MRLAPQREGTHRRGQPPHHPCQDPPPRRRRRLPARSLSRSAPPGRAAPASPVAQRDERPVSGARGLPPPTSWSPRRRRGGSAGARGGRRTFHSSLQWNRLPIIGRSQAQTSSAALVGSLRKSAVWLDRKWLRRNQSQRGAPLPAAGLPSLRAASPPRAPALPLSATPSRRCHRRRPGPARLLYTDGGARGWGARRAHLSLPCGAKGVPRLG